MNKFIPVAPAPVALCLRQDLEMVWNGMKTSFKTETLRG